MTQRNVLHILLIDDSPGDVFLVREAIRSFSVDADVAIAWDGEQVLRFIEQPNFEPDLIFLDLNLPKFDGFQILEQLRRRAPVIVLSGSVNPAERARSLGLGAQNYIIKPSSFNDFVQAMRAALERLDDSAAGVAAH